MLLKNGYYHSMMRLKDYSFFVLFLVSMYGYTQNLVSGKVINGEDNRPLEGVEIYAKNESKTVYSDASGNFKITISEK